MNSLSVKHITVICWDCKKPQKEIVEIEHGQSGVRSEIKEGSQCSICKTENDERVNEAISKLNKQTAREIEKQTFGSIKEN